ncbi:MAG: NRAMP family divalent metal transporter [Hymenobacter sp.]
MSPRRNDWGVLLGAAFLMATSAVGPGFLTQTTVFTQQLGASFGFVILVSILIDLVVQLNVWRVIVVAERRAPDLANAVLPGLGSLVAGLVALGGLAFNIGNVAGAALGLNVLFGLALPLGALLTAGLAIVIFMVKEAGRAMDRATQALGALLLLTIVYVAITSHPPVGEALRRTAAPTHIDLLAIITLVGGTVGGYITFAGGHRLLDAGVRGPAECRGPRAVPCWAFRWRRLSECCCFWPRWALSSQGLLIDKANPPASVFRLAAGPLGYKLFGVVMFAAALTSVIRLGLHVGVVSEVAEPGRRPARAGGYARVHPGFDANFPHRRQANPPAGAGRCAQRLHPAAHARGPCW